MARGATFCKNAVSAAARNADASLKAHTFVASNAYLHEQTGVEGNRLIQVGVSVMKDSTFDALMLSCVSADPEVSHADVYVTYPFHDLPEDVQTGLQTESITNEELEEAALDLPDRTIQRVMWRISSASGTDGATVGYEAAAASGAEASEEATQFGIRSRGVGGQAGDGPHLVPPGDAAFPQSVEQVTALAAEVEGSFTGPS